MPTQITLRDGTVAHSGLVATTLMVIKLWLDDGMRGTLIFFDAISLARDPMYKPFGSNGQALADAGFLDGNGQLHRGIADILRASADGEGMDLAFVDPRQPEVALA